MSNKGKFRNQMHNKGLELDKLRNELVKPQAVPTASGYKLQKDNSNYIDKFVKDLYEQAKDNRSRTSTIDLEEGCCLFRKRQGKTLDDKAMAIYFNVQDMIEYADCYATIINGKSLYFVPYADGRKVLGLDKSVYPYLMISSQSLCNQINKAGVEYEKKYQIHRLESRDNEKVWFVEL